MQVRDTTRNHFNVGAFAIVCAIVQIAFVPYISFGVGRINMALVFAAVVAMVVGGRSAVFWGFTAGLFFDLCTTGPIGLMALLLTLMSLLLGLQGQNRLSNEPMASLVDFAITDFIVSLLYHLTMLFVDEDVSLFDLLVSRTLTTFVLTIVVFVIVEYFIVHHSHGSGSSFGKHGGGHYQLDRNQI